MKKSFLMAMASLVSSPVSAAEPQDFAGDYLMKTNGRVYVLRVQVNEDKAKIFECNVDRYILDRHCSYGKSYDVFWENELGGFCFYGRERCKDALVIEENSGPLLVHKGNPLNRDRSWTVSVARKIW